MSSVLTLPYLATPSWQDGYASNAVEALHPQLWPGLVGAWMTSLGPTGATLRDISGYGNHGALTGMDPATDWVVGENGYALDYDGTNDYVSIPHDDRYSFGNASIDFPFSLVAYINVKSLPSSFPVIVKYQNANTGGGGPHPFLGEYHSAILTTSQMFIQLLDNNNTVRLRFSSVETLSLNTWHLCVWVYDGAAGMKMYLDGVELSLTTNHQGSYVAMHNLGGIVTIGGALVDNPDNDTYANGQIGVGSIYSRMPSSQEIQLLHRDPHALVRLAPRVPVGVAEVVAAAELAKMVGGRARLAGVGGGLVG